MNERAAEARRRYKREWARKNPDKIRAQQARYWEKKALEAEAGIPVEREQPRGDRRPAESI